MSQPLKFSPVGVIKILKTCAPVAIFFKRGIFSPGCAKRFWRVTKSSELVDDTAGSEESELFDARAVKAAVGAFEIRDGDDCDGAMLAAVIVGVSITIGTADEAETTVGRMVGRLVAEVVRGVDR